MNDFEIIQIESSSEEDFEKDYIKIKNKLKELKNKEKKIIFSSNNDELNRKILEKEEVDILVLNLKNRKDYQKQRNSGFNHVMAKLAKSKKVIIGINLDEIIEEKSIENKSKILGRIKQNIKICNKNKLQMKFLSISGKYKKDSYDLKALGSSLGMPSWMTSTVA